MDPLTLLADKYGSDKGTKGNPWAHNFTPFYHEHFQHLRKQQVKILEIGVQSFASHRMWLEYFPKSKVYGMDVSPIKSQYRIEVFVGNQGDRSHLLKMMQQFGGGWDIIIDDGGHIMGQQQTTLATLFPYLKPKGLFVVEDLHTSNFGDGYGVREDKSNSTLLLLQKLRDKTPATSEHMNADELEYLKRNIKQVIIHERDWQNITSVIYKV